MDRRFEVRRQEMLAECEVTPEVFEGVLMRMNLFVQPFVDLLTQPAQRERAADYLGDSFRIWNEKILSQLPIDLIRIVATCCTFLATLYWQCPVGPSTFVY